MDKLVKISNHLKKRAKRHKDYDTGVIANLVSDAIDDIQKRLEAFEQKHPGSSPLPRLDSGRQALIHPGDHESPWRD